MQCLLLDVPSRATLFEWSSDAIHDKQFVKMLSSRPSPPARNVSD
jgi:hypothetical protein